MSNSLSDDYFAFMSRKGQPHSAARRAAPAPAAKFSPESDTIDFEEESQIEVVESIITDTMIQRIFKKFSADAGAAGQEPGCVVPVAAPDLANFRAASAVNPQEL